MLTCSRKLAETISTADLLGHVFVLDLTNDKGSFCSKLLGDLGAIVLKVDRLDGNFSDQPNELSSLYDNSNKSCILIDINTQEGMSTLLSFIKKADILLEDFIPDSPESEYLQAKRIHCLNPELIHISITPFGRTGITGNSFNLAACQPHRTACLFAAVAALIRLRKKRVSGKGSYLDLSVLESIASMLESELTQYPANDVGIADRPSDDQAFSIIRCNDGHIQIPIRRCRDTLGELIAEGQRCESRERFCNLEADVENWARKYTKSELMQLGQAMGFSWASIDSIEEVLKNPQLKSRKFFISTLHGKAEIDLPGMPYRFSNCESYKVHSISDQDFPNTKMGVPKSLNAVSSEKSRPQKSQRFLNSFSKKMGVQISSKKMGVQISDVADEKMLKGIQVLDLTRMISGPYATRILADFGAEVLKLQTERTSTGAERNDSPQFALWNRNKKSITLDLDRPNARTTFLQLVASSDVVVENFSPRVMANWGLEYDRLCEVNPNLVMLSISAMGHTGPWKNFVGFAPNFHALSGHISTTSIKCNIPPADIGYPYADLISGLYAALAILAAIEHRDETGSGQYIDLSAFEATCTFDARFTDYGHHSQHSPINYLNDPRLAARNFLISLPHPVLGKVVGSRTPLWDWNRKPKWKPAPLLGEHNDRISEYCSRIRGNESRTLIQPAHRSPS